MDSGVSVGVIAGVSVAACVLILAIVLVVIYCYVKLRNNVKTVKHVEDGKADSSWSTKASSNCTASTHDRSEVSRASNGRNDNRGPDSSQEISSISSTDSVFGYNNVSFNPNADDKDRKKKVAFHSKHVYNNDAFDSTGTGDSSIDKIKYKKKETRNGSLAREARSGSSRKARQRNSSVDKDSVDSRRRTSGDSRQSRSVDRGDSRDKSGERDKGDRGDRDRGERSDRDRKPSNGQSSTSSMQRTSHSGTRSSGRSRSRSSGRRSSGRSGSHSRRNYARSASSDTSRRSSHKSALPPEQRPSITAIYANRAFRDDDDRTPSPEDRDQVDHSAPRPESQV